MRKALALISLAALVLGASAWGSPGIPRVIAWATTASGITWGATAQITPTQASVTYDSTNVVTNAPAGKGFSWTVNGVQQAALDPTGDLTVSSCTGCGGGSSGGTAIGVSGTNPATLGTLKLWLKADADVYSDTGCTAVITSGGQVACWKDQSGNGRDFVGNAVVATRPRYYYSSQATHGEIFYSGTQALERASVTGLDLATYTQCVVTRDPSTITGPAGEVFVVWNFGASNGTLLGQYSDGSSQFSTPRDGPAYPDSGLLTPTNGFLRSDTPNVHCLTYDGTTHVGQSWVNGGLVATHTGTAAVNYSGALPVIGSLGAGGGAENFHGTIDEILEYDTVLGGATLDSAMNYLRARWNVGNSFGGGSSPVSVAAPLTLAGQTVGMDTNPVFVGKVKSGSGDAASAWVPWSVSLAFGTSAVVVGESKSVSGSLPGTLAASDLCLTDRGHFNGGLGSTQNSVTCEFTGGALTVAFRCGIAAGCTLPGTVTVTGWGTHF